MRILLLISVVVLTVSFNAFGTVRTWDGGGADDNLRTAANWVGDVAPVSGDDLVFPAVSARYNPVNNMPFGSTIRSITFEGGTYTMSTTNALLPQTVSAGITVLDGTQTINFLISLSAPQTFAANGAAAVCIVAGVSMGSRALTIEGLGGVGLGLISGSGPLLKNGTGAGLVASATAYSGAVTIDQGIMVLDASMPSSSVTVNALPAPRTFNLDLFGLSPEGAQLLSRTDGVVVAGGVGGTGTVGPVNVINGAISAGTLSSPNGIFNTGSLTIGAGGAYVVKIAGPTPGQNGYDQLNVAGTVSLDNAQLEILPTVRLKRSIMIIKNDGADPVVGTFLNAPEGTVITSSSGYKYRISYVGGDGNDVVLSSAGRG